MFIEYKLIQAASDKPYRWHMQVVTSQCQQSAWTKRRSQLAWKHARSVEIYALTVAEIMPRPSVGHHCTVDSAAVCVTADKAGAPAQTTHRQCITCTDHTQTMCHLHRPHTDTQCITCTDHTQTQCITCTDHSQTIYHLHRPHTDTMYHLHKPHTDNVSPAQTTHRQWITCTDHTQTQRNTCTDHTQTMNHLHRPHTDTQRVTCTSHTQTMYHLHRPHTDTT